MARAGRRGQRPVSVTSPGWMPTNRHPPQSRRQRQTRRWRGVVATEASRLSLRLPGSGAGDNPLTHITPPWHCPSRCESTAPPDHHTRAAGAAHGTSATGHMRWICLGTYLRLGGCGRGFGPNQEKRPAVHPLFAMPSPAAIRSSARVVLLTRTVVLPQQPGVLELQLRSPRPPPAPHATSPTRRTARARSLALRIGTMRYGGQDLQRG